MRGKLLANIEGESTLFNHVMFDILGRHPLSIIIAA
jgi:hypothetical protein